MIVIVEGGKIVMYSETGNPSPGVGQQRHILSDDQAAELRALAGVRNDALLFDGATVTALPAGLVIDPAAR